MTRTTLLLLLLPLALASCLKEEKVTPPIDRCNCTGIHCFGGKEVVRQEPSQDAEEGDPCMGCKNTTLATCVDGCMADNWNVQGCSIGYACKTWLRVKVGSLCTVTSDCEPGEVDGTASNTLVCEAGRCKDVGAAKFAVVPAPKECKGGNYVFGPTAECDGAGCVGESEFAVKQYCAVAKCVLDADCPTGWFCRCQEEPVTGQLKAWRWCTPKPPATPDAGK